MPTLPLSHWLARRAGFAATDGGTKDLIPAASRGCPEGAATVSEALDRRMDGALLRTLPMGSFRADAQLVH